MTTTLEPITAYDLAKLGVSLSVFENDQETVPNTYFHLLKSQRENQKLLLAGCVIKT